MHREPTSLATWVAGIARLAESRGLDARELFAGAGLDYTLLTDPEARFPITGMTRLWRMIATATGDPCVALDVRRFLQPASYQALGFAILASETLGDVLKRSARFSRLVTDAGRIELESGPETVTMRLVVPAGFPMPALEAFEAVMADSVNLARVITGDSRFAPLEVRLVRPPGAYAPRFAAYFCCPVQFGRDEHALVHDRRRLAERLPMANPELARLNDQVAEAYLQRFGDERVSTRVRTALTRLLADGEPTEEAVASRLHMSRRSLQRALADEGTTFTQVLADVRQTLAREYVRRGSLSMIEITFLLGFADQANFTRAFKRWTGQTPSAYRLEQSRDFARN